MTYLHTTPATRDRAAPGLLVALGAPPSDTEQCFIIWENGVVYCEYDWRDDLWVQRDFDPITGERAYIDPSEIIAHGHDEAPARAFYRRWQIENGYVRATDLDRAIREATDEEIEDALAAQTLMENDQ